MKPMSELVKRSTIPESTRLAIVEAIKGTDSYLVIAERFDVHPGTVSKIAKQNGIQRQDRGWPKDGPVERRRDPNQREGGIVADDAQWKARQRRIGG